MCHKHASIFLGAALLWACCWPVAAEGHREPLQSVSKHASAEDSARIEGGTTLLWTNGPFINCQGCGNGGADESVVQTTTLNMDNFGFGHDQTLGFRVADSFVVPSGHTWDCESFVFWAYQTGSDTTSTITALTFRVWDGPPAEPGSSVVFGDTNTNRLSKTQWSGVYRATEEMSGVSTDRPIMENTAACPGLVLEAGEYWVDWATEGDLESGPWTPPITINGVGTTGDALQSSDAGTSFSPIRDGGEDEFRQGLPFRVFGSTTGPTLSVSGSCPGDLVFSVEGATPSGFIAILNGLRLGASVTPAGACAGVLISVVDPQIAGSVELDESGNLNISFSAVAGLCGYNFQVLDLEACIPTNVASWFD